MICQIQTESRRIASEPCLSQAHWQRTVHIKCVITVYNMRGNYGVYDQDQYNVVRELLSTNEDKSNVGYLEKLYD